MGNCLCNLASNNVVSTNIIKPTSVILPGVNIELYGDFFTSLYVELLDAVLSKDVEQHLTGILTWYFDYILLCHPRVASAR